MLLAAILLAVLSVQIWWTSRCIRSDFLARGLRVRRIRWQPFAPLLSLRWTRRHMLYRVWYSDGRGAAFTCRVVASLPGGVDVEDERRESEERRAARGVTALAGIPWTSVACSAVGCVAIGLSYWTEPYSQVDLPNGLFVPGLLLVFGAAAALQFRAPRAWRSTFAILALAPLGTVVLRIVWDVLRDSTSHNLFPFELVIAGMVGGAVVALGMGLGWVARQLVPTSAG